MNTTINKALLSKRKWKPYAVPDAVMEYIKELEEILNSLSSGDRKKDLNGRCEDFDAVNCLSSYYELANYKLFKNAGLVTNFIDAKEGEKSPDIEITFPDNTNLIVECKSVNIFPRENLLQKMKAFGIISSAYGSERRPKSLHIKNIASKGCHAKSLSGKLTEHFKNDLNKSFISSSLEFSTEAGKFDNYTDVGTAISLELPAFNPTDLINKALKGKKNQLSKINLYQFDKFLEDVSPTSRGYRFNTPLFLAEIIPSLAASFDNMVKIFKDAVGEEIIFKIFPDCFMRV